jgi:hypothetical protein
MRAAFTQNPVKAPVTSEKIANFRRCTWISDTFHSEIVTQRRKTAIKPIVLPVQP